MGGVSSTAPYTRPTWTLLGRLALVAAFVFAATSCSLSAGVEVDTDVAALNVPTTTEAPREVVTPVAAPQAPRAARVSSWATCLVDALVDAGAPVDEWLHEGTLIALDYETGSTEAWNGLTDYLVEAVRACPEIAGADAAQGWDDDAATAFATGIFETVSEESVADHTHYKVGLLVGEVLETATAARECLVDVLLEAGLAPEFILHPVRPDAANSAVAADLVAAHSDCASEMSVYLETLAAMEPAN